MWTRKDQDMMDLVFDYLKIVFVILLFIMVAWAGYEIGLSNGHRSIYI